jgi:hypothetical protein
MGGFLGSKGGFEGGLRGVWPRKVPFFGILGGLEAWFSAKTGCFQGFQRYISKPNQAKPGLWKAGNPGFQGSHREVWNIQNIETSCSSHRIAPMFVMSFILRRSRRTTARRLCPPQPT